MGGVRIEARDVSFHYGGPPALEQLSLSAEAGSVTAVLGPSGSGKSTLLAIVAGLLRPSSGDVLFDGRSVLGLAPERRQVGMVFQSYALFPHLSVEENVAFGLRVRGLGREQRARRVAPLLERFQIAALARRSPQQLSGGEQQRVALARALAFEPQALLLDEPLSALDARLRLSLRGELAEQLRASGVTVLYVTHDQEEAMALGDRVAVLRAGRLEQIGTPESLYRQPATSFVASFIGEANFVPARWFRGEEGVLMIRPEAFRLASPGEEDLRGTVLGSMFLGSRKRVCIEARGRQLQIDLPAGADVTVGDSIALSIDFEAAIRLRDAAAAECAGTDQPLA